ncbi:MAG: energy transducer TonB [Pseudomonadota bacterium]|uniref:Protein TonB n=2 Tax=Gallaecimonas pentaromativorans TaxID=584787 RepID=A0A3N1PL28_9GAMM|nr:energy transducer TonB [Gallaecimonas pentaromativorans]MED5524828.1 energy transducer TonB [Pseudomonadota bacterium]ROQ28839.1 TonB family protein [Gallaecimonas pentaromativorans]
MDSVTTPAKRPPVALWVKALWYPVVALGIWGIYADFVPSDKLAFYSVRLTLLLSVVLTFWVWWAFISGRAKVKAGTPDVMKFLAMLMVPPMMWFLIWLALAQGLPALITRFTGSPYQEAARFEKQHQHDRYMCDYRLSSDFLFHAFPSFLCSNKEFVLAEPKDAVLNLKGYRNALGFDITDYQLFYPKVLRRIDPHYPPAAAAKGIEGFVEMAFDIDPNGVPVNIHIADAKPRGVFDGAAAEALKQWRYQPLSINGYHATLPAQHLKLRFRLKGQAHAHS